MQRNAYQLVGSLTLGCKEHPTGALLQWIRGTWLVLYAGLQQSSTLVTKQTRSGRAKAAVCDYLIM